MSTTRIPRTISPMNVYINVAVPYFDLGTPKNSVRLGIEDEEVTTLKGFLTQWNLLYARYADKSGSRTTLVIDQLNNLIQDFIEFDKSHKLLDRIASSLEATVADFSTFNIAPRNRTQSKVIAKSIGEQVQPILQVMGGGVVSVKCYSNESSRPSIHSMANCLQYAYTVGTAPASPLDEALKIELSTRASFNLSIGADNMGKQLFIYFRWYNTIHPDLSGPWSNVQATWLS